MQANSSIYVSVPRWPTPSKVTVGDVCKWPLLLQKSAGSTASAGLIVACRDPPDLVIVGHDGL
jgi:hypothetical protein